jgi:sugar fermentation stimulation protein A
MHWTPASALIEGNLVKRYKRFMADIRLADGSIVTAHCANTGSMKGCRPDDAPVLISAADDPKRKLKFTWELVNLDGTWVGINTARPNRIVEAAITDGTITELNPFTSMRREVKYGSNSRIDILLTGDDGSLTYVEVKNTTLAEGGIASFPDSVTERGTKHMNELANMTKQGHRAAVVFLVHRDDCHVFKPADEIDPTYGKALRDAANAGVMLLPYMASCGPDGVKVLKKLPVEL